MNCAERPLMSALRGDESPGNIDVRRFVGSPPRKIAGYLAKYIGKTFGQLSARGRKRFSSSKGIREPVRSRRTMPIPLCGGADVLMLRRMNEAEGYVVEHSWQTVVEGRQLIWMCCRALRRQRLAPG